MYYSYLDDFHCAPLTWADLFERNSFKDTKNAIQKVLNDFYSKD